MEFLKNNEDNVIKEPLLNLEIYKEKIEYLKKTFHSNIDDYMILRNDFLLSPDENKDEKEGGKSDLDFSSLLKELEMEDTDGTKDNSHQKIKPVFNKKRFIQIAGEFKKSFEVYYKLVQDFYSEVYSQSEIEDTDISELRDAILGVYRGIVPLIILEQKLTILYNQNENFLFRLADFQEDEEILLVKEKLKRQKEGFIEINNYFNNLDRKHLIDGLKVIEESGDAFIKANELISAKEIEKHLVTCFMCGGKNPSGVTFCKSCKGPLPFSEASGSSIDISDTGQISDKNSDIKNEDVRYIIRLIGGVIKETLKNEILHEKMLSFSEKVSLNKKNMEKSMRPYILKNPNVKELKVFLEQFLSFFDRYSLVIKDGMKFFENGNCDHLKKCASDLTEIDRNMRELTEQVNIYMEKSENKDNELSNIRLNVEFSE